MRATSVLLAVAAALAAGSPPAEGQSHPPLRAAPKAVGRPAAPGAGCYADGARGNDSADGTAQAPWKTINHALRQLKAGDTLYLRGVFHENVYVALAGKPGAPITIRSAPGELAVIDGGIPGFVTTPAAAWQPIDGAKGEFRSAKRYPNLRNVVGSFGDSMIGLQTYHHAKDFRAESELLDWEDWQRTAETDLKPFYCGPGLWYDPHTGYLHARLAHTHVPGPFPNYRGETDPRKLPLIVAPFHSTPLHVDGASHVRFQDLVIRGGGYVTVLLDHAVDVEFDNVVVWSGTYGIRAAQTGPLRFLNSALYGNVAPWTFRSDASKRDYPGRPHRNISRLNTHALLEIDAGRESSVYATPQNDRWEIAHSEFTDAHDGLYLGGINVRFHHNLVENLQDDGLYLSPMYHRHRLDKNDPQIHVYQNVFRTMLTALAFGGSEPETRDKVFVYRNVFDLRGNVSTGRPSVKKSEAGFSTGKLIGDHGSPPWPALSFYHNTCVSGGNRQADMATFAGTKHAHPRRVFNNLFWHTDRLPAHVGPSPAGNVVADGNLYWSPAGAKKHDTFFAKFRKSASFAESQRLYKSGSESGSLVADPRFVDLAQGDVRLAAGSPAIDAGVQVPAEWSDPLRGLDAGRPDLGALPAAAGPLKVGRRPAADK